MRAREQGSMSCTRKERNKTVQNMREQDLLLIQPVIITITCFLYSTCTSTVLIHHTHHTSTPLHYNHINLSPVNYITNGKVRFQVEWAFDPKFLVTVQIANFGRGTCVDNTRFSFFLRVGSTTVFGSSPSQYYWQENSSSKE